MDIISVLRLLLIIGFWLPFLANASVYNMPQPGNDIVGQITTITIQKGDSFNKIRQEYDISYHELLEANSGVNPYRLRVGQEIVIPTQFILPKYRNGIVINTTELRLYFFTPDGRYVFTTPLGLGQSGWRTPTAMTRVVRKEADPIWYIPESIAEEAYETSGKILPERILPGPDNPLGKYALYLALNGYLLHGTNSPSSVGKFVSHGCMRFGAEAIEFLYNNVEVGTRVYIIHHEAKAGWLDGRLYFEAQEPVSGDEEPTELNNYNAETAIEDATKEIPAKIEWDKVYELAQKRTGIPTVVGFRLNHEELNTNVAHGRDYGIPIN